MAHLPRWGSRAVCALGIWLGVFSNHISRNLRGKKELWLNHRLRNKIVWVWILALLLMSCLTFCQIHFLFLCFSSLHLQKGNNTIFLYGFPIWGLEWIHVKCWRTLADTQEMLGLAIIISSQINRTFGNNYFNFLHFYFIFCEEKIRKTLGINKSGLFLWRLLRGVGLGNSILVITVWKSWEIPPPHRKKNKTGLKC